ncbi:MAG: FomA family porin-like outer membrane protein, partial [Cetobacterium sp.]
MKKLALLMGSLLIVAATASAKEVVAAPVVVEESKEVVVAPVVVIEEVKPAFRPNGSIGQELEYYGNKEHASDSQYFRFRPVQGNINLTEKVSADFRARFQIGLQETNGTTGKRDSRLGSTDFRTRWYYKHGKLGDTQIDMRSRLRFEKGSKFQAGMQYDAMTGEASSLGLNYIVEYNLGLGFANYFPSNDYFKVTKFDVTPSYSYMFQDGNGDNYANTLGLDLFTSYKLPWGFSADINLYAFNTWANVNRGEGTNGNYKNIDNYQTVALEAYLYDSYKLAESNDGRANLMFLFEGGYDPYT